MSSVLSMQHNINHFVILDMPNWLRIYQLRPSINDSGPLHNINKIYPLHRNVADNSNCLPHVMITVICSPGVMEAEYESSFRCESCENDADCWVNYRNCDAFVRDVTERMDVRNWVRFVSGEIKSIDT